MSNHQKRLAVPNSWPVERKEETYTTTAGAGPHGDDGVPLLIILRDVLGYADSKKEARYALGQDSVLVNGTPVSDERRPIGMFDILTFREREEHYRVFPDEGGRLSLTPIDPDAAGSKLGKIEGKRQVPGGDTQLTLHDGQTLLVDEADQYGANDSIVVSNEDSEERSSSDDASGQGPRADEVVAHFPYEEGALVTAVRGAHAGRIGTIDEIQVTPGSSANNVLIEDVHGEADFETVEEYVVVIDENFVEGADADDATERAVEDEADADEDVDDSEAEAEDDSEAEAEDDSEAEAEDDSEAEADEAEEDSEADADEAEEDSETEPDEDVDDSEADQADAEDDGGDDE
jgi:small subunit ribosomal protein S4e